MQKIENNKTRTTTTKASVTLNLLVLYSDETLYDENYINFPLSSCTGVVASRFFAGGGANSLPLSSMKMTSESVSSSM
uniref:Uncharacterized protein n=1 Tax=Glossina brevipalpis TaxID=37001 RepID=A0A1A9WSQ4_9MUSC